MGQFSMLISGRSLRISGSAAAIRRLGQRRPACPQEFVLRLLIV